MGRAVPDNIFWPKQCNSTYETFTKKLRNDRAMTVQGRGTFSWTGGESFRFSSPLSNCTVGDARVSKKDVQKWTTEVRRDKDLSCSFRISALRTSIRIIPYLVPAVCFSILYRQTPFWSFVDSKPLSQLRKCSGLPLKFLNFFKGPLLPYFFNLVLRQLLIVRIPQLEDIFSILPQNLCARVNLLGLRANGRSCRISLLCN